MRRSAKNQCDFFGLETLSAVGTVRHMVFFVIELAVKARVLDWEVVSISVMVRRNDGLPMVSGG